MTGPSFHRPPSMLDAYWLADLGAGVVLVVGWVFLAIALTVIGASFLTGRGF